MHKTASLCEAYLTWGQMTRHHYAREARIPQVPHRSLCCPHYPGNRRIVHRLTRCHPPRPRFPCLPRRRRYPRRPYPCLPCSPRDSLRSSPIGRGVHRRRLCPHLFFHQRCVSRHPHHRNRPLPRPRTCCRARHLRAI
ncbi:unnamed protein product, partial [Ectocarpus sp. 12 AP-2014]